ncbi:MAG: MarR family transcriptional regulator [Gallionellaceae bacterium]|nr:MarR family transcriptional regulator [Gallionellaceae bacterium]MDD5363909.1 MarR family transcriptional regulator [Gallionellaceae bacterium]
MHQDFAFFEQGIDRIARQIPGMPQDRVVLNRLFFFVFRELDEAYNLHLADFGLNSSTFLALAMLMSSEGGQLNPCHLSDALIASRTNVTRLADELAAAGWVERRPSMEDRRRVELSLTESGRALVLKVLPRVWQLIERQWADFSPAEVTEFDRLLRKLMTSLSRFRETA